MGNNFKNDEQRLHWNEYNKGYSKKHYLSVALKFSYDKDADIVAAYQKGVASRTGTDIIKRLIRLGLEAEKQNKK